MYFKRLEMQGFKSFVDPTSLDFEPGITGIIGPNGCGKSNIVDSIRWVLGEQSAKSLRGARMEDVIFNGTDQRKAVGMAEVTLTIDNQDKLLKSEHEEITITRRAFRSGDSEYLMNKVPCRLRDIHDLFMDTGVGTSSYSILEQGKIDLIVSSKPADRRMVFEEAAGISKYKARKEESLRKLEATEQNFLRVNDIAVEVRRQIGSLERQVQKARRYQAFKQELTTLEVSQGRKELGAKRRQLRKTEQQWEACQTRVQEYDGNRKSMELEISGLAEDLEATEARLAQMQDELHRVIEEMIKAEDFVASTELRKNDLVIGMERQAVEISALDSKENQLREQNAGTLDAREKKESELLNCREALGQEEERLNQLEQELKERAVRVQDQQNRLLEIVDQMSTLRGALKNLELRQGEQEQRQSKLDSQLETLNEQLQEILREKSMFSQDAKAVQDSLAGLQGEQAHLTQEKERLENIQKTLAAMLENFNKTITQLTSRLTWIEELKNGLDGYALGAKTILLEKNSHPDQFAGIIGPLVNFIRTDQKYEFAFEALLEHRLQYILVQSPEDAQKAVQFLQEGNRGRATFIPAENHPQANADASQTTAAWQSLPGVYGWAKDLARMDERFRNIFQALLSGVAIVEDRAAGDRARQAGAVCTLLTLNGEIQTAEQWLTGGSQDLMEKGLLGREREIEELQVELGVLERNLAHTQQEAERTNQQLEETTGSLTAVNAERHELEIKYAQLEKALEGLQTQQGDLEKQIAELQQERTQVMGTLTQIVADHQATAQKLMALEITDRQTQAELTNHQEEIEERRREYDERSLRAGELRVHSASLEQQLNSLNAETGRVTSELNEIAAQKAEKLAAIKRDQERLSDLDYQIREKQVQAERLAEIRQTQEQTVGELKSRREEVVAQKQAKESCLRQDQEALDALRQELHELELDKSQQRMNLKSLEAYLEQEYKLNLTLESAEEPQPEETDPAAGEEGMDIQERIKELKEKITAIGSVNLVAMEEYDELEQRNEFLSKQLNDLKEAKETLQRLITRINQESRDRFAETFGQVQGKFKEVFRRLFNGGDADLILVDETNLLETGIEIIARPPGKRLQNISLLSGGEKALTAIALLFAIFLIKPSPFCIFDEMDAPLDDNNTLRFSKILRDFENKSQFIVITHNKVTMEAAGVLYGVTMQESGVSNLISVKFKGDEKEHSLQPVTSMTEEVSLN